MVIALPMVNHYTLAGRAEWKSLPPPPLDEMLALFERWPAYRRPVKARPEMLDPAMLTSIDAGWKRQPLRLTLIR
jgi:hypothetical protein